MAYIVSTLFSTIICEFYDSNTVRLLSLSFLSDIHVGAVVAVIVWYFDSQLPMQSVPITTDVVSSNLDQGEVYNIM